MSVTSTPSIVGVIPARYASSRFPGKPLAMIHGRSMIQRVYEQAIRCGQLASVVVATDDARIFDHVEQFGGKAVMTRTDHETGSSRIGELARHTEADYFINIQGDEPLIDPGQISQVAGLLLDGAPVATLVYPCPDIIRFHDPNAVKVVLGTRQQALYFSRSPIPHWRDGGGLPPASWLHIGIYGFRRETLLELLELPVHPLEELEKLEQLRWLAHGYEIRCGQSRGPGHSVDRPEDVAPIEALLKELEG